MKKLYLLLIALLLIPTISLAEECSDADLVDLKTKASKTEFKLVPFTKTKTGINSETGEEYSYNINIFKAVAANLTEDFYYIRFNESDSIVEWDSRTRPYSKYGMYGQLLGDTYDEIYKDSLMVYGNSKCKDRLITTLYITVPKKNSYYSLGVCDGISDYYLCQEFLYNDYNITFDSVKKSTDEYRKGLVDKSGKKKEKKSILEMITNFTSKYFMPLLIILIGASGVIVFFTVKRRRRMKKHFK